SEGAPPIASCRAACSAISRAVLVHVGIAYKFLTRQAPTRARAPLALAPCPAERVKLRDQLPDFGGVEKIRKLRDGRAPWYRPTGQGATTPSVRTPGSDTFAGVIFCGLAGKSLLLRSDSMRCWGS